MWKLLASMTVTSTGSSANPLAAASPPNPAPMTTTWWRWPIRPRYDFVKTITISFRARVRADRAAAALDTLRTMAASETSVPDHSEPASVSAPDLGTVIDLDAARTEASRADAATRGDATRRARPDQARPAGAAGATPSSATEPGALRETIGDVLRDERHAQERTLAEVARDAAVSLPYLSEIERGRKDVSGDVLGSVCDALGLPLPDLLEESARRLRVIGRPIAPAGPDERSGSGQPTQQLSIRPQAPSTRATDARAIHHRSGRHRSAGHLPSRHVLAA